MQFGEYLDLWLETYVTPKKAPNTTACYRRAVAALPDRLLSMDLEQLNGLHIQAALNRKEAKHPRAAQLMYAMLSCAMSRAVKLRLIQYSPMDGVDKPAHKPKKTATLTAEQLRRYLIAARDSDHYPLLLLMAVCGLRRGEALGATWAAIDGDELHICQQRQKQAGKLVTRPLKSSSSNRVIPLPPAVLEELRAWPHRSLAGWICDSTPDRLYRAHLQVIEWAGLPKILPHGLRHSMATAMAEDGTPIKILQGILGHSHYQLTADLYADHIRSDAYRADLNRLTGRVLLGVSCQDAGNQGAARL